MNARVHERRLIRQINRLPRRYTNGRVVSLSDGVKCNCGRLAERCEYSRFTVIGKSGIAFYYYCDRCWITEGPDGTSPRDRASKS